MAKTFARRRAFGLVHQRPDNRVFEALGVIHLVEFIHSCFVGTLASIGVDRNEEAHEIPARRRLGQNLIRSPQSVLASYEIQPQCSGEGFSNFHGEHLGASWRILAIQYLLNLHDVACCATEAFSRCLQP